MAVGRRSFINPQNCCNSFVKTENFLSGRGCQSTGPLPRGLGCHEILFALWLVCPAQVPAWWHRASIQPFSPEVTHSPPLPRALLNGHLGAELPAVPTKPGPWPLGHLTYLMVHH